MDKPIMSAGPHIHSKDSSSRIMLDVIIARGIVRISV